MSFVGVEGGYFVRDGRRFFPVGVNYLPSYLCGNYFADYRAEHIREDLDHIAELGLNCVRVPVFWAGFEPREGEYSEEYLSAFLAFVNRCRERELLVIPVFLVGTWTGMYDAPYWKAPGMYQGEMLELEARHAAAFAGHFAEDPTILCWDLSDEPYYLEELPRTGPRTAAGRGPARREVMTAWVARLAAAIREVDPNHAITLGFDPHPVRADTGFALEEVAEHLEVMSYCIYPWPLNKTEVELIAYGAFQARFFAAGRPAFLHEGPGMSSSVGSESLLAGRFRAWMYSSLVNGNIGVLPWNYTDYEEAAHQQWPLEEAPLEPNFGICRADRSLKPQGEELLRFAADVRRLPLDELTPEAPRAFLVYPHGYYEQAERLHEKLWRHFALCKGANINVGLVREDRLPAEASLLIAPGFRLRLSTWARLREFAAGGGTLLGMMDELMFLNPMFGELFGVRVEGWRPGVRAAALEERWGGTQEGEVMSLPAGPADRVWVVPQQARRIATFEDGYPLLVANEFGEGRAFLATAPFPAMLDLSDAHDGSVLTAIALLRGVREAAGCRPTVEAEMEWVETGVLRSAAGDDWAVLVNYDRRSASGMATVHGDYASVAEAEGEALPAERKEGALQVPLHLEPHGVLVWRLAKR